MDWHRRFLQQAAWTRDLRAYLFERLGLERAHRVLEVGCGTGAVLSSLGTPALVHGLDLELSCLAEARAHVSSAMLTCGDALALPYPSNVFDISFCHFLLLWVTQPRQALAEMKRVTRHGGAVLALAEPDYYARLDEPAELAPLGRWQTESLKRQGAEPGLGKRLADLFEQAGIREIESGPLVGNLWIPGGQQSREGLPTPSERALEWEVLEADLVGWVPAEEIRRMKLLDERAWAQGVRVLQVPTYFAWGIV